MKSQELRIGNWVNKDLSVDDIVTIQVEIGDLLSNEVIENLYPIPLTEEWLLRLGIKDSDKRSLGIWNNGAAIYFDYGDEKSLKLNYVHQLQNLYYALTGEEL